jgi:hypothetical protein
MTMFRRILKSLITACTVSFGLAALTPTASAFNPQPEPPEISKRVPSKLAKRAFNPQPEPPEINNGPGKRFPKLRRKFGLSR